MIAIQDTTELQEGDVILVELRTPLKRTTKVTRHIAIVKYVSPTSSRSVVAMRIHHHKQPVTMIYSKPEVERSDGSILHVYRIGTGGVSQSVVITEDGSIYDANGDLIGHR